MAATALVNQDSHKSEQDFPPLIGVRDPLLHKHHSYRPVEELRGIDLQMCLNFREDVSFVECPDRRANSEAQGRSTNTSRTAQVTSTPIAVEYNVLIVD